MVKKIVIVSLLAFICIVGIGLFVFFTYSKKSINIREGENKSQLEITPRTVSLPLAHAEGSRQEVTSVLYGTIDSIKEDTLLVKERSEETSAGKTYNVRIDSNTVIMQSTVNEKENKYTISSKPRDGDSFVLRVGAYVEIDYWKGASETDIVAERIIYSE